jgi:hypothetical protein
MMVNFKTGIVARRIILVQEIEFPDSRSLTMKGTKFAVKLKWFHALLLQKKYTAEPRSVFTIRIIRVGVVMGVFLLELPLLFQARMYRGKFMTNIASPKVDSIKSTVVPTKQLFIKKVNILYTKVVKNQPFVTSCAPFLYSNMLNKARSSSTTPSTKNGQNLAFFIPISAPNHLTTSYS